MKTLYRPEIDGLRTIAVVSVLIYHAQLTFSGITLLPGGYLGVDAFFVISGYLISLILLKEMHAGTFTFRNFYERRARRILPVLFCVMLASSALAWYAMLPKALNEYAGSQLSSLFFGSNFWFWLQDSYTAEASELKPLLHTWSLSLEEQFYVFFPILLLALISWKKCSTKLLTTLLAGFFILSLTWAQYASSRYIDANFYLPASRSWELLCGSLIAIAEYTGKRGKSDNRFIPLLGLVLILLPMSLYHDDWRHPSLLTLAPVIGTGILIWSTPRNSLSYKILASRPFTSIGLVSYSLYLWHFPALAFAKIIKLEPLTSYEKIACLVASLIIAVIGYFLIELPARDKRKLASKPFFTLLLITFTALVAFSYYSISSHGAPQRLGSIQSIFSGATHKDSYVIQNGQRCDIKPINSEESCLFTPQGNHQARTIINIGDSHADVLGNHLLDLAKNNHWNYRHLTKSGCPYVEGAFRFKTGPESSRCDARQMANFKAILSASPPSIVVYSARFPGYINGQPFDNLEGGKESHKSNRKLKVDPEGNYADKSIDQLIPLTIQNIIDMGHTVVVVYPVPEVGWNIPKKVKKALDAVSNSPLTAKRDAFERLSISTRFDVYKTRSQETIDILDSIDDSANLIRIRPAELLCSQETNRCQTHNKSTLFYYDDNHLSQSGAKLIVDEIAHALSAK